MNDTALATRLDWVPALLADLLQRHDVPGGSVAVWHDGDELAAAAGMANLAAGIEATPETLFLIGSITKVYTATLVMQLVDDGVVALDAPVRDYVPELRLADDQAADALTVRHLLTHTGGLTGDYFPPFGRGDDAVERLVASLAEVEMLHRPGAMFSYSNSGFILAGRLVERVTGQTWDTVLRRRLLDPLGSDRLVTLPEEALPHRVGVGHVPHPATGELRPGQMWPEVRSGGPAGFTPFGTTRDLARFARMHLDGGVTASGVRLLSEAGAAAMQGTEVAAVPSGAFGRRAWGLGWAHFDFGPDERVFGHNGGSSAMLRMFPERRFAVACLTNSGSGSLVGRDLTDAIVKDLFGIAASVPPAPSPAAAADLRPYEGVYRHHRYRYSVTASDDSLAATSATPTRPHLTLRPMDEVSFLAQATPDDRPGVAAFLEPGQHGRPRYLHVGGRAYLREA